MARRSKSKTTQRTVTPETMLEAMSASIPAPSTTEGQSRIRGARKRFADWAIKKALDFLLLGVIGVMTTPAIAIWLYIRNGRAAWTYSWLFAAIGFTAACLIQAVASALLFYVKGRRRKALERARNLEFVSRDKGLLDHIRNQKKGFRDFNRILPAMGNEVERIGKTSTRATAQINLAKRILGARAAWILFRIASRTAARMNKHSGRLEHHLEKLTTTTDLLIESNIGYLKLVTPSTEQEKQKLQNERASLDKVLKITQSAQASMEGFRDSQNSVRGISQELNTAVNRMVHVTEGVIAFMRKADGHWRELIRIIDSKNTSGSK